MSRPYEDIVNALATQHGVDKDLITAIIMQESGGSNWRPRYEPLMKDSSSWYPRQFAEKRLISLETETVLQKMSWGPMQVMGATARWMGFVDDIPMLCLPEIGILYGVKYLKWLSKSITDESNIIAAYNGGPGVKKLDSGMWANQFTYVDKVYVFLREFRKIK